VTLDQRLSPDDWLTRGRTFWTIGYGQNGFSTAALLGAGTLLVLRPDDRIDQPGVG